MQTASFEIDPDIRRASTPPGWLYTDAAVFDRQRDAIFARSWQLIGDSDLARVPGQVHPFVFLDGSVGEPLLLSRDLDDQLHCVSNVCTHRGMLVCEHAGVERTLRCRYHGRRFGLDGRFQQMPEFTGVEGFPSEADNLAPASLDAWGKFLFVALATASRATDSSRDRRLVEFAEWIEPMRRRMEWLPLHEFQFDAGRSRDFLVRANWALYVENYLEGFHIPYVHSSLNETLDYGEYRTELFDWCSLQVGVAGSGEPAFDLPAGAADAGQRIAAYYWWLFPNLMFNFYPWGLSINVVRPLAVDRTRVSFLSYVWDSSKLDMGAGAALDRVEREDEAIVEAIQRAIGARLYSRGRYSPTRETGTHHFHRLLSRVLAAG